jgi:hypothetical protein
MTSSAKSEGSAVSVCTRTGEELDSNLGHAIPQAAIHWLFTAAVWVQSQVRSSGICGVQNGTGTHRLRILRVPLSILVAGTAPRLLWFMELSCGSQQTTEEIPSILWNTEVHYRVYKSPPLASVLSEMNSVQPFLLLVSILGNRGG